MADYYDSGLFSELGDLLGHDQVFYGESDVSSLNGDILKQNFITLSPKDLGTSQTDAVPELFSSELNQQDATDIDSLLDEGNMLLDKLMAANGLDLTSFPVDLADIDELIEPEPTSQWVPDCYQSGGVLTPDSPLSTLPSEPSSPVDLLAFEDHDSHSPQPTDTENELDNLLKSLMDGDIPDTTDYYDGRQSCSPTSSLSSFSESSYEQTDLDNSIEDSLFSDYSPAPAPSKAKMPKKKKSSTPYSKLPSGRKERKKLQNKEAAIRYRAKKKNETQVLASEEGELLERNSQLKTEVFNLEREIMCMKELLSDVFNIHSFS